MRDIEFTLRGAFIPLDALLKAMGLAQSGGRAKAMIAQGLVQVDGVPEQRKTRKLRAGQRVVLAQTQIRLRAASGPGGATEAANDNPGADGELAHPPSLKDEAGFGEG